MTYDGNCSSYWSYTSYDTSPSNSLSPSMIMTSIYNQQQPYYYPTPCQLFIPPSIPCLSKNLPNRFQYTLRQCWLLNEIYEHVPYPNSGQKNVIADRIGASREQIREYLMLSIRIYIIFYSNCRSLVSKSSTNSYSRSSFILTTY
jgi:hypothetical protein